MGVSNKGCFPLKYPHSIDDGLLALYAQGLTITEISEELKEINKQLEKAYKEKTLAFIRTDDLKMLYIYKYLLAQNNVDLCKRKINCTKYLERREYYERMIEFFVKDIKAKEMQ